MAKMSKATAEKFLVDVAEDKRFWCHDNGVFKNLAELQVALADMSEEIYRYHANETKNDFSKWVNDVIDDEKLARDLLKSTMPAQAARKVSERLAFLRKRAS